MSWANAHNVGMGTEGQVLSVQNGKVAWAAASGGGPHAASHQNNGTDEISVAGLSGVLADAQTPAAHVHAEADVTGLVSDLAGKAATSHAHAEGDVTNLVSDLAAKEATANKGAASGYASLDSGTKVPTVQLGGSGADATKFLRGDQTWQTPAGGSDPWTIVKVTGADFTTTSATAVDVTGLAFTPLANTNYEFEAFLMIRTATTTVNPRVGLAWPTGMTDGVAMIEEAQTATAVPICANGNINAALLVAVGGLPNTTQSWPARVHGMVRAGASPSSTLRIQLASETAGTTVRVVIGSYLRYRSV